MSNTKGFLFFLVLAIMAVGCTKDDTLEVNDRLSTEETIDLRSSDYNFTASLKGRYEVPPVETKATGHVSVKISKDESSIYYKITVANIDNVFAAHFHLAPPDESGPVVATLYANPDQPSGPAHGVLVEGVITAEDVTGLLAGDLAALIEQIRAGNIYVNVHTLDYPGGEIRGNL